MAGIPFLILLVVLVLTVGASISDRLRLRQEEVILHKLSVEEAAAYYEILKQRARRARILRAITLGSVVLVLMALRRRFLGRMPAATPARGPRPTSTDAARALALAEVARVAAREGLDPASFQPGEVTGDDKHPWIFEYTRKEGDRLRVYVDRDGGTEVHRIVK
jgi:hypothetical protein